MSRNDKERPDKNRIDLYYVNFQKVMAGIDMGSELERGTKNLR